MLLRPALANHKVVQIRSGLFTQSIRVSLKAQLYQWALTRRQLPSGNPWYLNTLAAAEQLYDALYTWNMQGYIIVTSTSLAFFKDFSSSSLAGQHRRPLKMFLDLCNH